MNKRCRALTEEEYIKIITLIKSGFEYEGQNIRPNERIAVALMLEGNLGIRISDVLRLRLPDIIKDGKRYRLDITEKKTGKKREYTVPIEVYSFIQEYALCRGVSTKAKLFDISERVVQKHLAMAAGYLKLERVGSHSFRKFFSTRIYVDSGYDMELVRRLLQHSSIVTTQRYIGISQKRMEDALTSHVILV